MKFPAHTSSRRISRILVAIAAVSVLCGYSASNASAATGLTVAVQDETITGPTASFNVIVTNNTGSAITIGDTDAVVYQDIANSNVVFGTPTFTTSPPPIHSSSDDFINYYGAPANNDGSHASDNYSGGAQDVLAAGQTLGLMNVPFTVLNGFTGSLLVDVDTNEFAGTQMLDSTGDPLSYTALSGTLTISAAPEPASLALLGLCAPLLLRRRRRVA